MFYSKPKPQEKPQSDFLPTEPTEQQIDWTKPQPFPDGYVVPEGIRVVKIAMDDAWVKNGSVGKTTQFSSCPDIEWKINPDYFETQYAPHPDVPNHYHVMR